MELSHPPHVAPIDGVLELIVSGLLAPLDAALVRVWLLRSGDRCAACGMRSECSDRRRCLHLVASAGASSRTDGPFRRFPLGAREVGRTATTGSPWFAADGALERGLADPGWLSAHRIQGFVAWPLRAGDDIVGVLAAFSRRPLGETDAARLEAAAARMGAMLARDGRMAELARRCETLLAENVRLQADLRTLRLAAPTSMADATGDPGGPDDPGSPGDPRDARAPRDPRDPRDDEAPDRRTWVEIEREALERVLRESGWRVSGQRGAAARLGLRPTTLESRMKRLGVRRPERGSPKVPPRALR